MRISIQSRLIALSVHGAIILAVLTALSASVMLGQASSGTSDWSVDHTLDYMNHLLDTSLFRNSGACYLGTNYVTGHVFVDKSRKIWYSRSTFSANRTVCFIQGYFGAKATDIDVESIMVVNTASDGPVISVGCGRSARSPKRKTAKSEVSQCVEKLEGPAIDQHFAVDLKGGSPSPLHNLNLSDTTFIDKSSAYQIISNNDDDAMQRFVRAFKHLVIAVRALPASDANDPFSK